MKVVPELLCTNIELTKKFYVEALEFEVKYERPEERFVYFTREGVDLMCEELTGAGRRWITGEMERPFGRGINLEWEVSNIHAFYERLHTSHPECIYMDIETQTYERRFDSIQQTQFIVQDLDGYLFRFCNPLI